MTRMSRAFTTIIICVAAGAAFSQNAPPAQQPTSSAAAHVAIPSNKPGQYDVNTTHMETLLADPGAKAVLAKYIPQLVDSPEVQQAASMSLKDMQQALQAYAPDLLSDDKLSKIQQEFSTLTPKS